MFSRVTPKKWCLNSAYYPCEVKIDRYGNETFAYSETPSSEVNVSWQSLSVGNEQADYGGRSNEKLQAVFFNKEHESLEFKQNDVFVVRNVQYSVCSVEFLPSCRIVAVERVR